MGKRFGVQFRCFVKHQPLSEDGKEVWGTISDASSSSSSHCGPLIPGWGRHDSQLISFCNSLGVCIRSLGSESEPGFCTLVVELTSCGITAGGIRRESLGQKLWEKKEPTLPAPSPALCGSMLWHNLPRHSEAFPALHFFKTFVIIYIYIFFKFLSKL